MSTKTTHFDPEIGHEVPRDPAWHKSDNGRELALSLVREALYEMEAEFEKHGRGDECFTPEARAKLLVARAGLELGNLADAMTALAWLDRHFDTFSDAEYDSDGDVQPNDAMSCRETCRHALRQVRRVAEAGR